MHKERTDALSKIALACEFVSECDNMREMFATFKQVVICFSFM